MAKVNIVTMQGKVAVAVVLNCISSDYQEKVVTPVDH
jgi:hypothetical protein